MNLHLDPPMWVWIILIIMILFFLHKYIDAFLAKKNNGISKEKNSYGINKGHIGDNITIHNSIIEKSSDKSECNSELYKLCLKVLYYIKDHNMQISEEEFNSICGNHAEYVFEELKMMEFGSFANGYKSIWSITDSQMNFGIRYYQSKLNNNEKIN